MQGFSPGHKGLVEGLGRNASKYAMFLIWAVPLVLPFCAAGLVAGARRLRSTWRAWLLGLLWVGPSWAFSFGVFAGNAGLIFPLLPILYLTAAWGLCVLLRPVGPPARGAVVLLLLAVASAVQFTGTRMLPETDQRNVIFNVTLLRYSGPGLLGHFSRDLEDYRINPSLRSVLRQLRDPEPVPAASSTDAVMR
jgi:hypothetical protein